MMDPTSAELEHSNATVTIPKLGGSYTIDSSENVNEYLKGLGVGLVSRKVLSVAQPVCTISYNVATNQWTVVIKSIFSTKEATFKLLEKFSDETFDGRKCATHVELSEDGKVMTWYQTCVKGPSVETIIASTEAGITETHKYGEIQCEFRYRRGLPLNQL